MAPARCSSISINVILKDLIVSDIWESFCEIDPNRMLSCLIGDLVNVGLVNNLVPSGNKHSPEPILNQIYVATWYH